MGYDQDNQIVFVKKLLSIFKLETYDLDKSNPINTFRMIVSAFILLVDKCFIASVCKIMFFVHLFIIL